MISLPRVLRLLAFILSALTLAAASTPTLTTAERSAEIQLKEQRLRAFLAEENLDGVVIGTQRNFAWLTAGGDNHVVFNAEDGSALLLWMPDQRHVVLANNEAARITREELAGLGYAPVVFRWHEDLASGTRAAALKQLMGDRRIGSDLPLPGCVEIGSKLSRLRLQLTDAERRRYRWLGQTAAAAVEAVGREVVIGMTEAEIQGRVAGRLLANDILPTVLLVAADERIANYKHPITKATPVRREVMISVCARHAGLVVALTRHVHFGPLREDTERAQRALNRIAGGMLNATRPGRPAGEVIRAAQRAYADAGYADAWDAHHLGGAIGYREREYKAFPGSAQLILDHQAFAWNPTLPGVKAEDTVLVNGDQLENVTDTGNWPRLAVGTDGAKISVAQVLVRAESRN